MKGRFLSKYVFIATAILMLGFVGCKDRDDDITKLEGQISNLKTELPSKIEAVKTELTTALNAKITEVKGEISELKGKLADLEAKAATKAELDAVKKEILEKTVAKETYEAFVKSTKKDIDDLKAGLAKAVTKQELAEYKVKVAAKFEEMQKSLDALDVRVKSLDTALEALKKTLDEKVADLIGKIAGLKGELEPRIKVLEGLLMVKDGKSEVIEGINKSLDDQLEKIKANGREIEALKEDFSKKYADLTAEDKRLQGLVTELQDNVVLLTTAMNNAQGDIIDLFRRMGLAENAIDSLRTRMTTAEAEIDSLRTRMTTAEAEIDSLKKDMTAAQKAIDLNITNILTLSRQLKGLTFIPTRGLPGEKTMKLYYFAGDYTADHVLMYRVSPSNAKLGRDFRIESLNFQITTRSLDDNVKDASSEVDIHINGAVRQDGDIIYVPVHIKGAEACKVFGDITWWGNEFFHGENVLRGYYDPAPSAYVPGQGDNVSFPPHVVITDADSDKEVNYDAKGGYRGLSIVVTALTNDIKKKEGDAPAELRVKSSEHVNAQLIPTQIKLAEVVGEKGLMHLGKPGKPSLKARLLKFTLEEASAWANGNEGNLPDTDKNWNILMWSGTYNHTPSGATVDTPNPGKIDLNDYVTSYYYPQDGGDFKNQDVVSGDPFRHFYNEFGAFGEPYTDKPVYAKPDYEFELVAYEDHNHNIITLDKPETHPYAEIVNKTILKIKDDQIDAAKTKKVIVKVTQKNSTCEERQPVGYLVVKIVESSTGWGEANWTIDLTQNAPEEGADSSTSYMNLPYYHKWYGEKKPVGEDIENFKDALGGVVAKRFMNPLNDPKSFGINTSTANPGDINPILKQLRMIGAQHEFEAAYVINGPNSSVKEKTFKAAEYNHVNDAENVEATGVTADQAFKHVLIRFEKKNNSFVVYVDDKAPAGEYAITYKLEYKDGNVQYNRVLNLTFKFRVALREIKVTKNENAHNWLPGTDVIRVQYARIQNTINGGYPFLSENGYKVDLTEAFKLVDAKKSNLLITTEKIQDANKNEPGKAPQYRPRFEFIYDEDLVEAGFEFRRDANNYLTEIYAKTGHNNKAAWIEVDTDGWERLRIAYTTGGDLLYSYLTSPHRPHKVTYPHNMLTTDAEDASLERVDDMEKLLHVRMVTDINHGSPDAEPQPQKFANGNYYYIKDFAVKFERALRVKFTTVELTDKQDVQKVEFNFHTKDTNNKIYRGLFDHGDAGQESEGIGNLVSPYSPPFFVNGLNYQPEKLAEWYGLETNLRLPLRDEEHVDYNYVEVSTDGGNTWNPIPEDMKSTSTHKPRYIDINVNKSIISGKLTWTVEWQGNLTGITSPIWVRVPVLNRTAIKQGFNGMEGNDQTLKLGKAPKGVWATFRKGHAGVKGYAVFKINPRSK